MQTIKKHGTVLCTMNPADNAGKTARAGDNAGAEIRGGGLFARGGVIEAVGPTSDLPQDADRVIDMTGHVVIPGMVNTHHHLFQNLTRAVPGGQDALLFGWLQTLYPIWAGFGPEEMRVSAMLGLTNIEGRGVTR